MAVPVTLYRSVMVWGSVGVKLMVTLCEPAPSPALLDAEAKAATGEFGGLSSLVRLS